MQHFRSMEEAGDLSQESVVANADPPREEKMPTKIKEVLKKWGCTWMWKSLRLVGRDEWIKDTIKGWTLVAITNGLYINVRYPRLCLAAFKLRL